MCSSECCLSLQADEEIESVTIGGFWSSDDINSTLNVSMVNS